MFTYMKSFKKQRKKKLTEIKAEMNAHKNGKEDNEFNMDQVNITNEQKKSYYNGTSHNIFPGFVVRFMCCKSLQCHHQSVCCLSGQSNDSNHKIRIFMRFLHDIFERQQL